MSRNDCAREVVLEELLNRYRELPSGGSEARRVEAQLVDLVRPDLERVARTVSWQWRVPHADLVQEGLVAVMLRQRASPFEPGRVGVGRSAFPAWAMKLARQAMERAAASWSSPVHVTDHARKAVRRAKRTAAVESGKVSSVLRRQGLDAAAVYALGDGAVSSPLSLDAILEAREATADARDAAVDRRGGVRASVELQLALVDDTAERLNWLAHREAVLGALYRLPVLERQVVQGLTGVGRPDGQAVSLRTMAVELRLSLARVERLRDTGLARLREALDAQGLGPDTAGAPSAGAGELRRPRQASARRGHVRPGQLVLLSGDT
ncbi:hypothetical protein ACN47A_24535 [Myxococcus fulvus]|uniref:hypothetical protein n=1 Tax=Myxococcus fulvus TaxID=33 RepID=UPI003B9AA9E0